MSQYGATVLDCDWLCHAMASMALQAAVYEAVKSIVVVVPVMEFP